MFDQLHLGVLDRLGEQDRLDWSRASGDTMSVRGIGPRIARRGIETSGRLGRHRWKVERSLSWLSCWRRLGVRWDRDSGRWFAFVLVACAVVCFSRLLTRQEKDTTP